MEGRLYNTAGSLHDRIVQLEEAYRSAYCENKDTGILHTIKTEIDNLKNELRQLERGFHDEFKNVSRTQRE